MLADMGRFEFAAGLIIWLVVRPLPFGGGPTSNYGGAWGALRALAAPEFHVRAILEQPDDTPGFVRLLLVSQRLRDRMHVRDADLVACLPVEALLAQLPQAVHSPAGYNFGTVAVRTAHLVEHLDALIKEKTLDLDLQMQAEGLLARAALLHLGI